jgi:DNA-binding HxlR family transcriptional regulator
MVLLDLLGRRWALRIIWELRSGPMTSRALRAACDDLSPTVLQTRLNELRGAQLLTSGKGGYALTDLGRALLEAFQPLNGFAQDWETKVSEPRGSRKARARRQGAAAGS